MKAEGMITLITGNAHDLGFPHHFPYNEGYFYQQEMFYCKVCNNSLPLWNSDIDFFNHIDNHYEEMKKNILWERVKCFVRGVCNSEK